MQSKLHMRSFAYKQVFMCKTKAIAPWWKFWDRGKSELEGEVGRIVLDDLAHYCYATKPTLKISKVTQQSDPIAMAFAEGRRDVYNRIIGLCNLDHEQISRISQRIDQ